MTNDTIKFFVEEDNSNDGLNHDELEEVGFFIFKDIFLENLK